MKVLIIDNFDSYTFNLYQYVGEILNKRGDSFELDVIRNNERTLNEVREAAYDRIIVSPGPGDPSDKSYFGICGEVLTELGREIPVLGVCLGMQGMAHFYGGKVVRARVPMHGKTSTIVHDGRGVFTSLPQRIEVMRYHSLVADPSEIPSCLEVTAHVVEDEATTFSAPTAPLEIMGLRHREYPIEGVQFHPESFATEGGKEMIANFLFTH